MTKTTFEFLTDIDLAEFISRHAHDLRSPYNHIVGFTKMVLNEKSGTLNDMQKEDLSISFKSSMRALWMMNNLIDMARLSREERTLNPAELEINQLLDQTIAHWKKFNYGDNSTLASIVLTNHPKIKADEAQIKQVISSFITYVKDYMEPDPSLTISVEDDDAGWLFTVEATGINMDLHSVLELEMAGYVCQKYLKLAGGKIRMGEAGDGKATVKFVMPKELPTEE